MTCVRVNQRSVILKFVVVCPVGDKPAITATSHEGLQHVNGRGGVQRILVFVIAQILKAGLIHHLRADDLGVADLQRLLRAGEVIALGWRANCPIPALVSASR